MKLIKPIICTIAGLSLISCSAFTPLTPISLEKASEVYHAIVDYQNSDQFVRPTKCQYRYYCQSGSGQEEYWQYLDVDLENETVSQTSKLVSRYGDTESSKMEKYWYYKSSEGYIWAESKQRNSVEDKYYEVLSDPFEISQSIDYVLGEMNRIVKTINDYIFDDEPLDFEQSAFYSLGEGNLSGTTLYSDETSYFEFDKNMLIETKNELPDNKYLRQISFKWGRSAFEKPNLNDFTKKE